MENKRFPPCDGILIGQRRTAEPSRGMYYYSECLLMLIVIIHMTVINKVIAWYRQRLERREFEGKGKSNDEVSLLLS